MHGEAPGGAAARAMSDPKLRAREMHGEAPSGARWVTLCVRALHLSLAAAVALDSPAAGRCVAAAWAFIYACPWAHAAMLEATLATLAFALWVAMYRAADRIPALRHLRFAGAHNVRRLDAARRNSFIMGAGYMGAIYLFHCFKTKPPLDVAPPSARRLGVEVACGIVAYDVLEFCAHLLLHRCGPRVQHVHKTHHAEARLSSFEVLNHSPLDALQQVALNVLVQHISPWPNKHSLSKMVHNVMITYMLTEIHAGYDGPWCMHRVWPSIFGGAARHEVHHRDGNVYYAELFVFLDDLFGFVEVGGKPRGRGGGRRGPSDMERRAAGAA
jgi:sterol desaturase/sphingolipid hydroxylase (fatty acid hydroxylase superfamily)